MLEKLKDILADGMARRYLTASWPTYDGGVLDRNDFMTASEASRCLRRLAYAKTAGRLPGPVVAEPPSGPQGIYARGHIIEEAMVEALIMGLPDDWELHFATHAQVSFYTDAGLAGTPDGALVHKHAGALIPLEFKSVDPRSNLAGMKAAKPAHALQLQINAYLIQECFKKRPDLAPPGYGYVSDLGPVIYTDCSDVNNVRIFDVELNSKSAKAKVEAALDKADRLLTGLENHAPIETYPAEGAVTGECRYCEFASVCQKASAVPTGVKGAFGAAFKPNGIGVVASQTMAKINMMTPVSFSNKEVVTFKKQAPVAPVVATGEPVAYIDPVVVRKNDLRTLFFKFAALKAGIKDDEKELEDLKFEVIAAIKTHGKGGVLEAGGYRAELVGVKGRETFDKDMLLSDLGAEALVKYLKTGKPSERLDFKEVAV